MAKKIEGYAKLIDVCRSAGLWYVGSYIGEFLRNDKWRNPETKDEFIEYMYREYGAGDSDISGTITRVNCLIRIVESGYVIDALNMVLEANDKKLGCNQSKINAQATLDLIKNGKLKL